MTFTRVLVANRGEIAVRVIRACHDAGLSSVAVFADDDALSPHVRLADAAVELKGDGPGETYLNIDQILSVALGAEADAVHPGYGFLSENAEFAQAVLDAGLVWIGPPPSAIRLLGDKVAARRIAFDVGAPLAPGTDGPVSSAEEVHAFVAEHGYPVAIKAAHGGGGRGMKIAREGDDLGELFDSAVREATVAFGRGECFVERYLDQARHVEAQVLADNHGHVLVVGTRDCSLQRRNQKLVEEAPAPFLTNAQNALLVEASVNICRAADYRGAGTVEFLLAADGSLSFLEVNTRLQVEHTVTEETTGLDLVREQFRIAAGLALPSVAPPVSRHAFEFRINAEDSARQFMPGSGFLDTFSAPTGPGVRLDSGVEQGSVVGAKYDSLLAKLIVVGCDRSQALERARRALAEFRIAGVTTVLPFHRLVVDDPAFAADSVEGFAVHTRWIDSLDLSSSEPSSAGLASPSVRVGGRWMNVTVPGFVGATGRLAEIRDRAGAQGPGSTAETGEQVVSPMQGTVIQVAVVEGQEVAAGDLIAVVEAMKMENPVRAPHDGIVAELSITAGANVAQGTALCLVRT